MAKNNAKGEYVIDYARVAELIESRHLSSDGFSVAMGYTRQWFRTARRNNCRMTKEKLERMATILNVDQEELLLKDEPQEELTGMEPSQFEVDVLKLLKEIRQELAAQKTILMYLYNDKQQEENRKMAEAEAHEEPPKSEIETATTILEGLMIGRQAIKYQTYIAELGKAKIRDTRMADAAASKMGLQRITTGYGSNKVLWLAKKSYAQSLQRGEEV